MWVYIPSNTKTYKQQDGSSQGESALGFGRERPSVTTRAKLYCVENGASITIETSDGLFTIQSKAPGEPMIPLGSVSTEAEATEYLRRLGRKLDALDLETQNFDVIAG